MSVSTENFYKKHLTNLAEWQKMGEAGIFSPDYHLELINGEIIEMAPIGSNHAGHLNRLNKVFTLLASNQSIIAIQNPLQLSDVSEPEPDLMLLKPNQDYYCGQFPCAEEVLLLIEVADSSLSYDQNEKMRLYALHHVPEYWIFNLNDACIEVHLQPYKGLYTEKTTVRAGNKITLSQLENISINTSDLF